MRRWIADDKMALKSKRQNEELAPPINRFYNSLLENFFFFSSSFSSFKIKKNQLLRDDMLGGNTQWKNEKKKFEAWYLFFSNNHKGTPHIFAENIIQNVETLQTNRERNRHVFTHSPKIIIKKMETLQKRERERHAFTSSRNY